MLSRVICSLLCASACAGKLALDKIPDLRHSLNDQNTVVPENTAIYQYSIQVPSASASPSPPVTVTMLLLLLGRWSPLSTRPCLAN